MVTMTETAAKKVCELRLEEGKPEWGLRIRMVGGGCSGMSYELGWEDQPAADDDVAESQGIKVYIDKHSAPYLQRHRDRLRPQRHDGRRASRSTTRTSSPAAAAVSHTASRLLACVSGSASSPGIVKRPGRSAWT